MSSVEICSMRGKYSFNIQQRGDHFLKLKKRIYVWVFGCGNLYYPRSPRKFFNKKFIFLKIHHSKQENLQIFVLYYLNRQIYSNPVKELSLCHKIKYSCSYILATQCRRPLIFQTINSVRSNNLSLKYQRFTPTGCRENLRLWQKLNSFAG